jgi:hypothetical protein
MIAIKNSPSSTCSASASYFSKLSVEILQQIADYLVPKKYLLNSEPLLHVTNLFEAYPLVFPFLKCFKDVHDAGIVKYYPEINLSRDSPPMTTELLESLIQTEPEVLSINSKKYLSTALVAQFRKRTNVGLRLVGENLTNHDMNQIVLALQSKNNNITSIDLYKISITVNDLILLAKALEHKNNRVESLNISYYEINLEITMALANALIHPNCKLRDLDLWSSVIRWDGKNMLMNAVATVRKKRKLRYLC